MTEPTRDSLLQELRLIEQALLRSVLHTPCPSAEALASTAPFCYDTMAFETWLQWVFVPRMRQVLQEGHTLNAPCSMAPLAAYSWQERAEETQEIQARLARFDVAINRHFGLEMPE